ncbi:MULTISPECIES: hypothetical protein [unclassified Minwuia]|uniref:hypothetical protein n=1 Tax=unclassified Minwuia TaxID=2618799 RepID=UPI002479D8AF|nr:MULTISPECIES: hypothetical protein [unclassified Minwuia]
MLVCGRSCGLFDTCDQAFHQTGEPAQGGLLGLADMPWLHIGDTQCGDAISGAGADWNTGIGHQIRCTGDQGQTSVAAVQPGVFHDQRTVIPDRVGAERGRARNFGEIKPDPGDETQRVVIDQGNEADGKIKYRNQRGQDQIKVSIVRHTRQSYAVQGIYSLQFMKGIVNL